MKYRKKPVIIDAIQWDRTEECWLKLVEFVGPALIGRPEFHTVIIKTLEGDMYGSRGDFIIKDIKGEFYPYKPDIFKATYHTIEEPDQNNKIKKLICTIGLPRSGKSTWAKQQGLPIVNPDSIRLALYGQRFIEEAESFVWAIAKTMVNALFLAGNDIVILDATNTTEKRRREWISEKWKTEFKLIDTPKEICIERAKKENDQYIIPVIIRMADKFEGL